MEHQKNIKRIAIEDIVRGDPSSRYRTAEYDEDKIQSLAQSILSNGLLQDVVVCAAVNEETNEKEYRLVAGGRRLAAIDLIQDEDSSFMEDGVPCKIISGEAGEILGAIITENFQREDTDPDSMAQCAFDMRQTGMTLAEIGIQLGLSEARISQYCTYVENAIPAARRHVKNGRIKLAAAAAVVKAGSKKKQAAALKKALKSAGGKRVTAKKVTEATGDTGTPSVSRPGVKDIRDQVEAALKKIEEIQEAEGEDSPLATRMQGYVDGCRYALGEEEGLPPLPKPKKEKKAKKAPTKKAKKKAKKSKKGKKATKKIAKKKNLPTED